MPKIRKKPFVPRKTYPPEIIQRGTWRFTPRERYYSLEGNAKMAIAYTCNCCAKMCWGGSWALLRTHPAFVYQAIRDHMEWCSRRSWTILMTWDSANA